MPDKVLFLEPCLQNQNRRENREEHGYRQDQKDGGNEHLGLVLT